MLSGCFLHAILARWLGPEQYGIFGIISAFIIMIEAILLGPVARGVAKFIAQNEESSRSIINGGLKTQGIISFTIFMIFFLCAQPIADLLNDSNLGQYIKIFSLLIPVSAFYFIYESALNGKKFFGKQAITGIIFSIVKVMAVIFFVYLGYGVIGAIYGLILADFIRLVIGRHFCRQLTSKGDFDQKKLNKFALQMVILSSTSVLLWNIDLMAVKILLKENLQTGLYVSAQTLARFPIFIFGPISMTLFPFIAKSISEGDKELTGKYIDRTFKYLSLLVIPIVLLVSATSSNLISLVYSKTYLPAAPSLSILIFGMAFITINKVTQTVIIAGSKPYVAVFIELLLVAISIFLNSKLIPMLGISGAAWATTITNLIGCVLSAGYVLWHYKALIEPVSVFRIVLASLVIYVIALASPSNGIFLFINYLGSFLIFLFLLFIFREISLEDVQLVKSFIIRMVNRQ